MGAGELRDARVSRYAPGRTYGGRAALSSVRIKNPGAFGTGVKKRDGTVGVAVRLGKYSRSRAGRNGRTYCRRYRAV